MGTARSDPEGRNAAQKIKKPRVPGLRGFWFSGIRRYLA